MNRISIDSHYFVLLEKQGSSKTAIVGKRPAGASVSGRKSQPKVDDEPTAETTSEPAAALPPAQQLLTEITGAQGAPQPIQEAAAANIEKHYFITITYGSKKPKTAPYPQNQSIPEISEKWGKKIAKDEVFVLKLKSGQELLGETTVREAVALAEQAGTKEEPVELVLEQDDW